MRDTTTSFEHSWHTHELPEWFVYSTSSARQRRARFNHAAGSDGPSLGVMLGACSQCSRPLPGIPPCALRVECPHCGWRTPRPTTYTPFPRVIPPWSTAEGQTLWAQHVTVRLPPTPDGTAWLCFGTCPAVIVPLGWCVGLRRILRAVTTITERTLAIACVALCARFCNASHTRPEYLFNLPLPVGAAPIVLGLPHLPGSLTPHDAATGTWPAYPTPPFPHLTAVLRAAVAPTPPLTPGLVVATTPLGVPTALGGTLSPALPPTPLLWPSPGSQAPLGHVALIARCAALAPAPGHVVATTPLGVPTALGGTLSPALPSTPLPWPPLGSQAPLGRVALIARCEALAPAPHTAHAGSAFRVALAPTFSHHAVGHTSPTPSTPTPPSGRSSLALTRHDTMLEHEQRDVFHVAPGACFELWRDACGLIARVEQTLHGPACRSLIVHSSPLFSATPSAPLPVWDAAIHADEESALAVWSHPSQPATVNVSALPGAHLLPGNWPAIFEGNAIGPALTAWASTGFPSCCSMRPEHGFTLPNPRFTDVQQAAVEAWVTAQIEEGCIARVPARAGAPPFPFVCSPLGTAPKDDGLRVIHNLSAPFGSSVNDACDYTPLGRLDMLCVEGIARRMLFLRTQFPGVPLYAHKSDLRAAYRQLPSRQRDAWLMGLTLRGQLFHHTRVMWGAAASTHICSLFTNAICDAMALRGYFVCVCVDDFVSIEASLTRSQESHTALLGLLSAAGARESPKKRVPPCTRLPVVGVWIDLEAFTIGVTAARASALAEKVSGVLELGPNASLSLREAQSLTGKLNFISCVVPLSRPYVFSLFRWTAPHHDALRATPPNTCAMIPEVTHALRWWLRVLRGPPHRLCVSLLVGVQHPLTVHTGVSTDASDWGYGIVLAQERIFAHGPWDPLSALLSINARELAAVAIFAVTFGHMLTGRVVVVALDSDVAFHALLAGGSDNVALRMLTHVVAWAQEEFGFRLVARHLPGELNFRADHASRGLSLSTSDPLCPPPTDGRPCTPDALRPGASRLFRAPQAWHESRVSPLVATLFSHVSPPCCTTRLALYRAVEARWLCGTPFASNTPFGICPASLARACSTLRPITALPLST